MNTLNSTRKNTCLHNAARGGGRPSRSREGTNHALVLHDPSTVDSHPRTDGKVPGLVSFPVVLKEPIEGIHLGPVLKQPLKVGDADLVVHGCDCQCLHVLERRQPTRTILQYHLYRLPPERGVTETSTTAAWRTERSSGRLLAGYRYWTEGLVSS